MNPTHFVLLLVDNPTRSAEFYARLLGAPAIEQSPTFAMFALSGGLMLGLWSKHTVEPKPLGGPGSSELAFVVPDDAAVQQKCDAWKKQGVALAQEPCVLDFGMTFVGLDPDGHRLRVFAPA
ncbi:MAG: VOC family protein [Deltaproteobacteria bacterium]|nr:VOC family protein [Deltaproteobacteria bacterium]